MKPKINGVIKKMEYANLFDEKYSIYVIIPGICRDGFFLIIINN